MDVYSGGFPECSETRHYEAVLQRANGFVPMTAIGRTGLMDGVACDYLSRWHHLEGERWCKQARGQ